MPLSVCIAVSLSPPPKHLTLVATLPLHRTIVFPTDHSTSGVWRLPVRIYFFGFSAFRRIRSTRHAYLRIRHVSVREFGFVV